VFKSAVSAALLASFVVSVIGTPIATAVPAPLKPNVVVFYLDDTNPTDGRLWSDASLTPNLYDLFVAHGIDFDHAYGETPLCCPSRATLLTGLHTHNHGVYKNDVRLFNPDENVGKEMTAAGYSSMLIGKYMNLPNKLTPDEWTQSASGWSVFDAISSDSQVSANQYYYDYTMYTKDQGTLTFGEEPTSHSTRVIGDRAVMRLQAADPLKPVFQLLTLYNTHFPDIPMPDPGTDPTWSDRIAACSNMPPWDPPNYNEADVSDKPQSIRNLPLQPYTDGWPLDGDCREMIGIDWLVGQVVTELKAEGRYNNTVFMFAADNGMAWGEHRLGEVKQYAYVTHVPLYFSVPSRWGSTPRTVHEYVSDIDFAPTFCDIGGCTLGPYPGGETKPDGVSLLPLLDGTVDHLDRDALLEDNFESRVWYAVRTTPESALGLWHYVEWPNGFIELYDETNDPWEMSNVASDPANHDLEIQLHQRLWELIAEGRPDKPATVTIVEDELPDSSQDFSFSGTLGSFALDDDRDLTLPRKKILSVAPGTYTLTQADVPGWALSSITCPYPSQGDVASKTITFDLFANDNITCTYQNRRYRPDVSIAQVETGPYKGDNVYSAVPVSKQTQKRPGSLPGQEYDYFVHVQNDGKLADSFSLKADVTGPTTMSTTFTVDGVDVTDSVMGGTYRTPLMAPNAMKEVVIHVLVDASAQPGTQQVVLVHATSVAAPTVVDVVRAITAT
jgi:arylsulfatase A-like enzyme